MHNLRTILKAYYKYSDRCFFNKRLVMMRLVTLFIILSLVGFNKTKAYYNPEKNFSVSHNYGQVNISITPLEKNGVFTKKTNVGYKLFIKNGQSEDQKGIIYYKIENENDATILEKTFDLNIPANKKLETNILIPHTIDGSFKIVFQIELKHYSRS